MSSTPVYQPPITQDQPRYTDFYSFMTYADFTAWVASGASTQPDISVVPA